MTRPGMPGQVFKFPGSLVIKGNCLLFQRCTANLSEEEKKHRRKELNRLAAQRCRSKRRGHAEVLEQVGVMLAVLPFLKWR